MKNKIGWCNLTFNPCWGCLNNCEYCYARAMARRFWKQRYMEECDYYFKLHPNWIWTGDHLSGLKDFKPTWLESKFQKRLPRNPQRVFVGSMSEIAHWGKEWVEKVLEKVKQYPQHIFQFLTRYPEVYLRYNFPKNCWLGVTITKDIELCDVSFLQFAYKKYNNIKFICFEPLLRRIIGVGILKDFDWVIIGVETGNRKDKIIPKKEWVEVVIDFCNRTGVPLFIKDNLVKYYSEYRRYKEFPTINKL